MTLTRTIVHAAMARALTKMFEAFPSQGAGRAAAAARSLARESRG